MEVKVRDIHVRYEDSSGAARTLAAGVTLHSLEMKVRSHQGEKMEVGEQIVTLSGPNSRFHSLDSVLLNNNM